MGMTEFPVGDPLAVQRWSASLEHEAPKKEYFGKFVGKGKNSLIMLKDELSKGAGDKVTYGLAMKLNHPGIEGDDIIEGHATGEEALSHFSDALMIDQLRKSTKSKGKMSEQRVPYNIRKEGRDALTTWWAEERDEQTMCYLAGARGINADFHQATNWTGRAGNALVAPDVGHLIYGGDATGKADLDAADAMSIPLVERLIAIAETSDPMIQPFLIEGERKFVLLMHTFQAFSLRTSTTENDWLEIQKAVGARGKKNHIYHNALGEHGDVILHKHRNVIRFDDYGSGGDVDAARALFMGAQAGVVAYGRGKGKSKYDWHEESDDRGNALAITSGSIFGIKKCEFDSKNFGVMAVDTACTPVT